MSRTDEMVDAVVIGAGVVGLACARTLALRGRSVVILERHNGIGRETSARSSEVIHAGLYYPPGSLKARLCVAGRDALYAYCAARHIAHRRCGKLIVATTPGQRPALDALRTRAQRNGVHDLQALTGDEARALEPALHCVAALRSPSTGIVDSHALMLALLGDAQAHGAVLAVNSPVAALERLPLNAGLVLHVGGAEPTTLGARHVVNAAGHGAPALAAALNVPAPRAHWARGNYFSLSAPAPFAHLVYPLPEAGGAGVHLTLDLGGQARFGPDVDWLETPGDLLTPTHNPARRAHFEGEIRRYWPALPDNALTPAYAGVRPKIAGPGEPDADFRIDGPGTHGVPGLVNLFGIESPGLTAALAIGEHVADQLIPTPHSGTSIHHHNA